MTGMSGPCQIAYGCAWTSRPKTRAGMRRLGYKPASAGSKATRRARRLCLRLGTGVGDKHQHQAKGEPTENDDPTGEVEGLGGDGKDDQGDDDQTGGDCQGDTELATGNLVGARQVGLGEAHLEARKGDHGSGEDERHS